MKLENIFPIFIALIMKNTKMLAPKRNGTRPPPALTTLVLTTCRPMTGDWLLVTATLRSGEKRPPRSSGLIIYSTFVSGT